ncbi:PREDICTED: uncharacterized protein LOC108367029 isoform X2 [Rhagoletis zephyria]|uniref:uncharacterized protein LOC108367029 isoform X2 n=1 Tax=Rhagoletis zephyria TaxID=28612 RepID=UPI000811AACC|nr:PREDICTED: uncharacterized protein LOC108367029 isoform X2 [Rhagoletis zephyria]
MLFIKFGFDCDIRNIQIIKVFHICFKILKLLKCTVECNNVLEFVCFFVNLFVCRLEKWRTAIKILIQNTHKWVRAAKFSPNVTLRSS